MEPARRPLRAGGSSRCGYPPPAGGARAAAGDAIGPPGAVGHARDGRGVPLHGARGPGKYDGDAAVWLDCGPRHARGRGHSAPGCVAPRRAPPFGCGGVRPTHGVGAAHRRCLRCSGSTAADADAAGAAARQGVCGGWRPPALVIGACASGWRWRWIEPARRGSRSSVAAPARPPLF